jgi:hypothetical protein
MKGFLSDNHMPKYAFMEKWQETANNGRPMTRPGVWPKASAAK